jgi:hypothetical protein
MRFTELNDKLQLFVSNLNDNLRLVVEANEKEIVDINRSQMRAGKNAEGQTIGVYSSKAYDRYKKAIGSKSPAMVPDLLLTGAFQEAMILETEDTSYFITSNDEKTGELVGKYNDNGNIFGIAKENEPQAQAINNRKLAQLLKQATGL